MKQTGELPLTSEMAVSLVQSHQTSAMKRPADNLLLDNHLRLPSNAPPTSPRSYAHSPVSIVTQSPYKLPESYLSPLSLENTSPRQPNYLHSNSSPNGIRSDDEMPITKRVRLDEMFSPKNNNEGLNESPEKRLDLLKATAPLLSPKPHTWLENNTSPVRRIENNLFDAAKTPPPASQQLLRHSDVMESPQHLLRHHSETTTTKDNHNSTSPQQRVMPELSPPRGLVPPPLPHHYTLPTPPNTTTTTAAAALNALQSSLPLSLASLPPLAGVMKPLLLGSPARGGDAGELGALLENRGDASSAQVEEEGHEVCPECQKVFKRKIYLQRHLEREHWSTAKVFKCEDCNYETKHQSNLSVHRRTHTGERPYHCGACGQRYTQGHLLKSHIRSRHHGNMELYNLDKKSDSTRGRKSLDVKHELGSTPGSNHHHHHPHRADKISTLLQQAAAQASKAATQGHGGQAGGQGQKYGSVLPATAPPGSSMSNYMNALSSFYGMQQTGAMRNIMSSPLIGGGLMPPAANRFFALPGLTGGLPVSGMLPKLPTGMSLFSTANTIPTVSPSSGSSPEKVDAPTTPHKYSPEPGLKRVLSSAMPALNLSASASHLSPPLAHTPSPRSHHSSSNQPPPPSANTEQTAQDLSLRAPPTLSPRPVTPRDVQQLPVLSNNNTLPSNHHLVISDQPVTEQSQSNLVLNEKGNADTSSNNDERATPLSDVTTGNRDNGSSLRSRASSMEEDIADEQLCESRDAPLSPMLPRHHDVIDSTCGGRRTCSSTCTHAGQLRALRGSVLRMLRCLAPELSDARHVDLSTREVDDLLHDVIFSTQDELAQGNSNLGNNNMVSKPAVY